MIKKTFLGIAIGLISFFVFIYLGGTRVIIESGDRTQDLEREMKNIGKKAEKIQRDFRKNVEDEYREVEIWLDKRQ